MGRVWRSGGFESQCCVLMEFWRRGHWLVGFFRRSKAPTSGTKFWLRSTPQDDLLLPFTTFKRIVNIKNERSFLLVLYFHHIIGNFASHNRLANAAQITIRTCTCITVMVDLTSRNPSGIVSGVDYLLMSNGYFSASS
jgi:hypothetical protein